MVIKKAQVLTLEIDLDVNDIFNWLTECEDIDTLRYLGRYAFNCAYQIENKEEDDDFRSRA